MNSNAAAFSSQQEAAKFRENTAGSLMNWNEVYSKIQ
jgi:nitrous oxide reductase accessory protein NosL